MNGEKPNKLILVCWYVISPLFILVIWIFSWYKYEPIKYGEKSFSSNYYLFCFINLSFLIINKIFFFKAGAMVFGWSIALVSLISIPAGAVHSIITEPNGKTLYQVNKSIEMIICLNKFYDYFKL